jgi:hypothetical protein
MKWALILHHSDTFKKIFHDKRNSSLARRRIHVLTSSLDVKGFGLANHVPDGHVDSATSRGASALTIIDSMDMVPFDERIANDHGSAGTATTEDVEEKLTSLLVESTSIASFWPLALLSSCWT